jgi:hypothetical protein
MKASASKLSRPAFPNFQERTIVLSICLLAAVHVFLFSAAFPFFNIVDEQYHFDLVVRYAQGQLPHALDTTTAEAVPYIAIFGTPEYFWHRSAFADTGIPPPLWQQPDAMRPHVLKTEAFWSVQHNPEAVQPPLYYALAGLWWRLGELCGLHDGALLYAVRFLNIFFIVALVWVGFIAARLVFPENDFPRIAVPLLLAFLPQTTFYSINNDVLSPLAFGVTFVCVIRLWQEDAPGIPIGMATGFAIAATYLTKISNLPAIGVAFMAIMVKAWRLHQTGRLRPALTSLAALAFCASVPICCWLAWMHYHFGNFTGTATKTDSLGWTLKPFAAWWHHPIFTPTGLWTFISGLLATFWQGEFLWYGQPMTFPVTDTIYTVISLGFVGLAVVMLLPRFTSTTIFQRRVLWFGFWIVAMSVAFLAFLSIIYDFHDCFYPSRTHPYFTSGRLLGAALIPFLLLFGYGMDGALSRFKFPHGRLIALAGFVLFMIVTEITVDWPVFSNAYNWFHM